MSVSNITYYISLIRQGDTFLKIEITLVNVSLLYRTKTLALFFTAFPASAGSQWLLVHKNPCIRGIF